MRRALGLFAALSALLMACQLILGTDEPEGTPRPAPPLPGPADSGPRCALSQPVGPPGGSSSDASAGYWFAALQLDVPYKGGAGIPRGLDLDLSCTCSPVPDERDAGPSCVHAGPASRQCDEDGGVDDAFGVFIEQYLASLPAGIDPRDEANGDIREGVRTALVWIGRYNGLEDDDEVAVSLLPASGLVDGTRCPGSPDRAPAEASWVGGQGPFFAPRFDGCDSWSVPPGFVAPGEERSPVAINAANAYVSKGVLVAELGNSRLTVFGSPIVASDGHLVARIGQADGGMALDGFLQGRMKATDLLDTFSNLRLLTETSSGPFCQSPLWQTVVVSAVCDGRDVMFLKSGDHTGQACDATSVVIGIHALPARVSNMDRQLVEPPDACAPSVCP